MVKKLRFSFREVAGMMNLRFLKGDEDKSESDEEEEGVSDEGEDDNGRQVSGMSANWKKVRGIGSGFQY